VSLRDDLLSELSKAGMSAIGAELSDLSRECVRMHSEPCLDESVSVGGSKLGGLPDLPPGIAWPKWKSSYLSFVAQVNLAELPETDLLPNVGVLSFFYDSEQSVWGFDPNDKEGFRFWYFPEVSRVSRTEKLETLRFPCAQLSFERFLSLPDSSLEPVRDLLLKIEDSKQYYDFVGKHAGAAPQHQILGWPHVIQGDMALECQLVTNGIYTGNASGYKDPRRKELERGASDWTLLVQIDSDDNARMAWGDAGMLYIWIRRQDLASRAFDKAWTILQCF